MTDELESAFSPVRHSAGIIEIVKALVAAQKAYKPIVKGQTAKAQAFTYDYADLATVLDAVRPALNGQGIAVVQGTMVNGATVTVTTLLVHVSGEWFESDLTLEADSSSPQKVGSALTYGRRYGLIALIGAAPVGEDDDGLVADHDRKPPVAQPAPRPAPPRASRGGGQPPQGIGAAVARMQEAQRNASNRMTAIVAWVEGHVGADRMRDELGRIVGRTFPNGEEIALSMKEIEAAEAHITAQEQGR